MKKLVSLLLAVSMAMVAPVYAAEPMEKETIPSANVGFLVADDGTVYEVKGELVTAPYAAMSSKGNEIVSQTYKYDLSSISPRAGGQYHDP